MGVYYSGALTESVHGNMFQAENAVATAIAAVDTWTEISNFETGPLKGVTYASDGLTVPIDGHYQVNWNASAVSAVANKVFQFVIFVNDAASCSLGTERKFATNTDKGSVGSSSIIELSAGDEVTLRVQNITDDNNITITCASVSLHRI